MTNRERLANLDTLLAEVEQCNLLDKSVPRTTTTKIRAAVVLEGIEWNRSLGLCSLIFRAQGKVLRRLRGTWQWENGIVLPPLRRGDDDDEEDAVEARRRPARAV